MGIVEMIREREIKTIHKAGFEEGKAEVVKNLLVANKFTIADIANFAGVTKAFVLEVKKTLK